MGVFSDITDGARQWCSRRAAAARQGVRHWTILCWHTVADRDGFAGVLDELLDLYEPVSLGAGGVRLQAPGLQRPLLTLTFDDADQTVYRNCLPELARRSLPACLFVCTGYVDRGCRDTSTGRFPGMSWDDIKAWVGATLEVGAHTVNHIPLNQATPERAQWEILESQRILEQTLSCPVRHVAYPWGYYTDALHRWLEADAHFATVSTTFPVDNYPGQTGKHLHRKAAPVPGQVRAGLSDCTLYGTIRWLHQRTVLNGLAPVVWAMPPEERALRGE